MKINGVNVRTVVHETDEPQAIKKYLDSIEEDVVGFDVTPYTREPNVPRYLVVIFVKDE